VAEAKSGGRNGYNRLMTDSADHLAIAIRQIVKESVDAALRAQVHVIVEAVIPQLHRDSKPGWTRFQNM